MAFKQPSGSRQWFKALLSFLGAIVLLFLAILVVSVNPENGNPWAPVFFAVLLLFYGVRCLKSRSVDLLTLDGLDNDSRAPVLFLRPFTEDSAVLSSGARILNPLNPFSWGKVLRWRGLWASYRSFFALRWTVEQVLAFTTRDMGPLVAIGQPDTPPVLGAYNLYVGDDWQARVEDLALRAQLVVLVAGTTPGLLWEVEFMRTRLDPVKCVIFVPDGQRRWWWPFWRKGNRRKVWDGFRTMSAKLFPVPLPESLGRFPSAAFVGFEAGWKPFVLDPPRRPSPTPVGPYVAYMVTAIT